MRPKRLRLCAAALLTCGALASVSGCATNPVTGQTELRLVAESQEIAIGEANYAPSRQLQGGDWKTDAELVAYVQGVGRRLAAASDRPTLPYEFAVLNNGVPNAWALPGGKIAINRGLLLELENEAQLAAVLAHEVVHAAARHGAKSMERGLLLQAAVGATAAATSDERYGQLAVGGAALSAQLIDKRYGRGAELEADRYGMITMQRAGYDPRAAVALQEIFLELAGAREPSWLEGLFASHPPSRERVEANQRTAAELVGAADGLELGKERFRAATARLRASKDGYAALEEGNARLQSGDAARALDLAERAIAVEPDESRFYALRGSARLARGGRDAALEDFDRAIALDDGYFDLYVRRASTLEQAGQLDRARRDFERSLALLPTVLAHSRLGHYAEQAGNPSLASQHYLAIAATKTELGREAARSLARIEMVENPSTYLRIRMGVDARNMLVIEIDNRAPIAARGIELEISRLDLNGRKVRTQRVEIADEIAAGASISQGTNMGPFYTYDQLDTIVVEVVAAQPG